MQVIDWSKFSPKALSSIKWANSFINIYEGAVRSSKTVSSIIRWIMFVEQSPHFEFLMSGKTENTCYRNVIGGMTGIINIMGHDHEGKDRAKYLKSGEGGSKLEMRFPNPKATSNEDLWITKVVYVVGANDEKSEGKIRGMTIGGWYADEVTLYPEAFVKQAINRMSLAGAMAYWTCNPDSPYHYIKTEFIDQAAEKGYKVFHFELDDNYSLTQRYKDELKKAYKGLWYKRMVQGLWVMADGIIYDMFSHDRRKDGGNVVLAKEIPPILKYWVGVDYGQSNATVFLLFGVDEEGRCYVVDEYYHSGRQEDDERQKSPSQYAEDFWDWIQQVDSEGNPVMHSVDKIFIDPSAKGFILELYGKLPKSLRRKITSADNDVKFGIEVVTTVMGHNYLFVSRKCTNTLRELASYCWDPNAQKKGIDKPTKKNDHTMDALRYTIMGTRRMWEKIFNTKFVKRGEAA